MNISTQMTELPTSVSTISKPILPALRADFALLVDD
jgi:hypothetical protein